MAKNTLINVHEIVMATSDKAETAKKTALMRSGQLRKIAPKIYTTNMDDEPSEIVRRHIFYILGKLYPNAVISHRSAFEFKPTDEGDIYLTYSYTKNIYLPGVTVHLIEGPEGTANDMPFIENLYVSGNERRIMENLQKGRFWNVRLIIRRICGLYSANDYICGKMREICTSIRQRIGRISPGTSPASVSNLRR